MGFWQKSSALEVIGEPKKSHCVGGILKALMGGAQSSLLKPRASGTKFMSATRVAGPVMRTA
jgi:hypothetical protein